MIMFIKQNLMEKIFFQITHYSALTKLQHRKLISIENNTVFLTKEVVILVESIINTQFC